MGWLNMTSNLTKMEILARLFPFGKTLAGMRQVCGHSRVSNNAVTSKTKAQSTDLTLILLSDSGSSDCTAEPRRSCHAVHGHPARPHRGWRVWLQLPPTHTALQAIKEPLQMRREMEAFLFFFTCIYFSCF